MADEHGIWEPLSPVEVAARFCDLRVPWWIAGGWAIDLFVGRTTRCHANIDVQILRHDQLSIQAMLASWDLHAADPPGTLRPWKPGEILPVHVHDIWCRPDPTAPWALQLMLADTDGNRWIFRRDRRVSRPLSMLTRSTTGGIPYLAPEIQLLFKAKPVRLDKDEHDFATACPLLDETSRTWLATALELTSPRHLWIERLSS